MAKPLQSEDSTQPKSMQFAHFGVLNDGASPGQGTSDGSYVAMSGVQ